MDYALRRALVLAACERTEWNLQHAGELLGLGGTAEMSRALRKLGLTAVQKRHVKAGRRTRTITQVEPARVLASTATKPAIHPKAQRTKAR